MHRVEVNRAPGASTSSVTSRDYADAAIAAPSAWSTTRPELTRSAGCHAQNDQPFAEPTRKSSSSEESLVSFMISNATNVMQAASDR